MRILRRLSAALAAAALAAGLTACGSDTPANADATGPTPGVTAAAAGPRTTYPLTVRSCGFTATFAKAPTRVITYEANVAWLLARLGVADRIVEAGVSGTVPPPADLRAAIGAIPRTFDADQSYPSREEFLAARPDLHVASQAEFEFGGDGTAAATKADHASAGVQVFAYTDGCRLDGGLDTGLEDGLAQVRTLGRIFDVQGRAEDYIRTTEAALDRVAAEVAGARPTKAVFWGGSLGEDGTIAFIGVGARGIAEDLIARAGGVNIFHNLKEQYAQISREELARARPDVWVIPQAEPAAASTAKALFAAFPNAPASRQRRYVAVPYGFFFASGEYPTALRDLARAFHPDLVR